jgi:hypothetical protein
MCMWVWCMWVWCISIQRKMVKENPGCTKIQFLLKYFLLKG